MLSLELFRLEVIASTCDRELSAFVCATFRRTRDHDSGYSRATSSKSRRERTCMQCTHGVTKPSITSPIHLFLLFNELIQVEQGMYCTRDRFLTSKGIVS